MSALSKLRSAEPTDLTVLADAGVQRQLVPMFRTVTGGLAVLVDAFGFYHSLSGVGDSELLETATKRTWGSHGLDPAKVHSFNLLALVAPCCLLCGAHARPLQTPIHHRQSHYGAARSSEGSTGQPW